MITTSLDCMTSQILSALQTAQRELPRRAAPPRAVASGRAACAQRRAAARAAPPHPHPPLLLSGHAASLTPYLDSSRGADLSGGISSSPRPYTRHARRVTARAARRLGAPGARRPPAPEQAGLGS